MESIDVALGEPRGAGANITAAAHSTHKSISFRSLEWAEWFDLIVDGQCGTKRMNERGEK